MIRDQEWQSDSKVLRSTLVRFANLAGEETHAVGLTKEEMKNRVWLKPELVAQIEFTGWTPETLEIHGPATG